MQRLLSNLVCGALLIGVLLGCASVSPAQRGILAKPDMQLDHDLAHVKIMEHTYASKEAAAGGRATGGGGCGCGG
jgi:hypothetical protein